MKNLLFAGTSMLCLLTTPTLAADNELAEINRTVFETVDANNDGVVSRREIEHYRQLVMISMDGNDDGSVSRAEYMGWDLGWEALANSRGKLAEYRKARRNVFDVWDRDGDGHLSAKEQRLSQVKDFFEASGRTNEPMDEKQFSTGLRIIAALNRALSTDEPVTLINVFQIPAGKEAQALAMWDAAAAFLRTQPGYVSTALHKSILLNAKYGLINVAKWESIASFKQATAAMRAQAGIKPVEGLSFDASLYTVIRSD